MTFGWELSTQTLRESPNQRPLPCAVSRAPACWAGVAADYIGVLELEPSPKGPNFAFTLRAWG